MSTSDDFLKKRLQAANAQNQQTKPCPYCGEQIAVAAKKCRFCGELLDEEERAAREQASRPQPVNQTVKVESGCAGCANVALGVILVLGFLLFVFLNSLFEGCSDFFNNLSQ